MYARYIPPHKAKRKPETSPLPQPSSLTTRSSITPYSRYVPPPKAQPTENRASLDLDSAPPGAPISEKRKGKRKQVDGDQPDAPREKKTRKPQQQPSQGDRRGGEADKDASKGHQ